MKDPLLMELLQLHRIGVLRQVLETNRIIGQQAIIKAEDIHDEKSQCEQLDCLEADKNQEENEEDGEMSFIIAIKPNKVKVVEEGSDVNNKLNVDDLSLVMNQMNISESFDSPTRLIDEDDKYIDDDFPINLDVLVLNEKKSVCDSSNSCRNKNGKLQLFQKSKAPLKDITNVANFHNNAINKCTPKSNKVMVDSVNNSFLVADNWIHCSFSPICASSFQVDSHEMADCAMTNNLSDSIVDNEVMVDVALDSDDKNAHGNMVPLQLHNRKRPAPRTTKYDNIVNKIQQNEFYGASYVRYSAPTDEFIKETLLEYFNRSEHTRSGNLMNLGGLIIITTKAKIDAWANVVRSHLSNRLLVYNAETLKSRRLKGTTGLSLLYYDIIITTFDLIKAKDMKVSKQELNSYLTGRKQEDWYELGDRGNASEDRSYLQLLRWKQSIVDFGDTKTCKFDSVKGAAVCNLVSDHRTLMVQTCSEELDGVKEVANIQKMLKLESKTPLAKITINYT